MERERNKIKLKVKSKKSAGVDRYSSIALKVIGFLFIAIAGYYFIDAQGGDLIAKIIKQYSTSTQKVGKVVNEAEDGGMSSSDYKSAQNKSKEAAKAGLPDLLKKLVDKIEILKDEDYNAYVKVLNDLDKYKFGATNTKGVMKMILKALNEPNIPAIGSKRKTHDEDELKKLGIDDEPIEIDNEENI